MEFAHFLKKPNKKVAWLIEDSAGEAKVWLRAWRTKHNRKMKVEDFRKFVNTDLCGQLFQQEREAERQGTYKSLHGRKAGQEIGLTACTTWLRRLGWRLETYSKGQYFDGHERPDVVEARQEYIKQKYEYDKRIIHNHPTEQEKTESLQKPLHLRLIVEVVHDEAAFNCNDDEKSEWVGPGEQPKLKNKSRGAGLMASVFFTELDGPELEHDGVDLFSLLEYGAGEWWTSDKMIRQLHRVIDKLEKKYPYAQLLFHFDHSSNHKVKYANALNAKTMNVGDGGKQPFMHDTKWTDSNGVVHTQSFVMIRDGVPTQKGLVTALNERGISTVRDDGKKLTVDELRDIMHKQPDFLNEPNVIESIIRARGHLCQFYPKFHCELSPIEPYWGAVKKFMRYYCSYSKELQKSILFAGLRSVCLQTCKRFFGKCRRVEHAYRNNMSSSEMHQLLNVVTHRKYASHRRADPQLEHEVSKFCYCSECPLKAKCTVSGCQAVSVMNGVFSPGDPCTSSFCLQHGSKRENFQRWFDNREAYTPEGTSIEKMGKVVDVLDVRKTTRGHDVQVRIEGLSLILRYNFFFSCFIDRLLTGFSFVCEMVELCGSRKVASPAPIRQRLTHS